MIYVNQAARDYEFQELLSSTIVQSGLAFGVSSGVTMYWTWGNEYRDDGVGTYSGHGVMIQLSQVKPDSIAAGNSYATFVFPQLDIRTTLTFSGIVNLLSLLKINGAVLTEPDCDSWQIDCTSLEWIVGSTSEITTGSISFSGVGYDARLNGFRVQIGAGPGVVTEPTWPPCNATTGKTEIASTLFGGWRHKPGGVWTNESIDIAALSPPSVSGCTCTGSIKGVAGTNCWETTVGAYGRIEITDVRQSDADCVCASNGVHASIQDDLISEEVEGESASLSIQPEDAGITFTEKTRASRCYNNTNTPPIPPFNIIQTSATEAHTLAAYRVDYSKWNGSQHCYTLGLGVPPCPLGTGSLGGYVCADPDQKWCKYDYYLSVTQPNNACGDCDAEPWNFQEEIGHYHETCTKSGSIVYKFSYYDRPKGAWAVNSVIRAGSKPRSCVGPDRRIALVYESGGNAVRAYSYDNGNTFTTGTMAIANGYKPTNCYGFDGTYYEFALVYNSGTSGPGKIKGHYLRPGDTAFSTLTTLKDDVGADLVFADDSFNVEAGRSTAAPLVLHGTLDGAASTSRRASYDHGLTWKVITP